MKTLFITIIITICIATFLYAGTPDKILHLFYSANSLYEEGKYKDAIEKYENIIEEKYTSGPLYYNLGNCYFKLGALGKTILYYERAKRLMPNDPELKFNYKYVRSLLEDKIRSPHKNWLTKKFITITRFLSLSKWIGLTITIWLIFIILAIIAVSCISCRKAFKYIGISTLVVIFICVSIILNLYYKNCSKQAVILAKEVPIRYGPGEALVEAFLLHEGTLAAIKNYQGNWVQIQLVDGKSGWLPKDTLEEI